MEKADVDQSSHHGLLPFLPKAWGMAAEQVDFGFEMSLALTGGRELGSLSPQNKGTLGDQLFQDLDVSINVTPSNEEAIDFPDERHSDRAVGILAMLVLLHDIRVIFHWRDF